MYQPISEPRQKFGHADILQIYESELLQQILKSHLRKIIQYYLT